MGYYRVHEGIRGFKGKGLVVRGFREYKRIIIERK